MKRIILGIVCIIFSGYAYAVVAHPENPNIVGLVSVTNVCFNNDGTVTGSSECIGSSSSVDEGYVSLPGDWAGGILSGINGCGTSAVNPVSDATCPSTTSPFASCTNNGYVLVQTTKSGHYWAVKADNNCSAIATPETTGLVPCLATDAFSPYYGCGPTKPTLISVKDGYIKLDTVDGIPPSNVDCDDISHEGRMLYDSGYDVLYICSKGGWVIQ